MNTYSVKSERVRTSSLAGQAFVAFMPINPDGIFGHHRKSRISEVLNKNNAKEVSSK